jgi:hypothetical protein
MERLQPERLSATHLDAQTHQNRRRPVAPYENLNDYRAILHVHVEDSLHTAGTFPEVLRDAKAANVSVIMLSDHFRTSRDFMNRWRGLKDGVLFIPGCEADEDGYLLHPEGSILSAMKEGKESWIAATKAGDGLIFLSHIEDFPDLSLEGLTGMEIYNRHADAKDEGEMMGSIVNWLTDPDELAAMTEALSNYHAEVLASHVDYPTEYFAKWDAATQVQRVVGIAANDTHHNQVFIAKKVDDHTVRVGTIVDKDEDLNTITADQRPGIAKLNQGHMPGDIVAKLDLDPYAVSFHTVSTHILAPELTEAAVRAALASGRAYVSHDWMCDPTGFKYYAQNGDAEHVMGSEFLYKDGITLHAEFPVGCVVRVLRNGKVIHRDDTSRLDYPITTAGAYRIEGWLLIDGEYRPWIYSNPIYLR